MGTSLLAAVAVGLAIALLCLAIGSVRSVVWQLLGGAMGRYEQARGAERRAEALLRGVLTPVEYARLVARGYLDVRSPSRPDRAYRIPRDGGIVVVREAGHAVGGLCVQSVEPIPSSDAVAMHKLMIEGAEVTYLQRANHLSVGALSRYGLGVLYDR